MFKEWTSKRYFRGELQGNREPVVKCSDYKVGISSRLCSPDGEVKTRLYIDEKTARTMIEINVWDKIRRKYLEVYNGTISGCNFRKVGK